ncbi:MAG: hypothetical protein ACE5LH_07110 [Fidelibacterota bacterium]
MEKTLSQHGPLAVFSSVLGSVPWCCILPASLSLFSVTGTVAGRLWMTTVSWLLLPVSVALLARAFWLIYVRDQGAPWARGMTWVAAVITAGLWASRVWVRLFT